MSCELADRSAPAAAAVRTLIIDLPPDALGLVLYQLPLATTSPSRG